MPEPLSAREPERHHERTTWSLAAVFFGHVLLNVAWMAAASTGDLDGEYFGVMAFALLAFQPTLFGAWTALGTGSILMRLAVVLPCQMFLYVVPCLVPKVLLDTQRFEFVALLVASFAIHLAATILLLIFRATTGLRIQTKSPAEFTTRGLQFSTRYLLILMTLYAVLLGVLSQLRFESQPRPPSPILAPNFFIEMLLVATPIMFALVFPAISVPLYILHGRPSAQAIVAGLAVWIVATLAVLLLVDGAISIKSIGQVLTGQLVAAIAGAMTAVPLRLSGLRLSRPARSAP